MKTLFPLLLFCLMSIVVTAQEAAAVAQDATAASHYNEGLTALKAKEYAKGYELMLKAIEMADPEEDKQVLQLAKTNGARAAYYAGNAAAKGGDMEDALAKFEKGLELNPQAHTCAYGKGKALYDKEMYGEAIDAYLMAASIAKEAGAADKEQSYS